MRKALPGRPKPSQDFRKTGKAPRRQGHELVLVPDLVILRDSGRISPAECAAWSQIVGLYLKKRSRPRSNQPDSYAIRRTRSGWRIFYVSSEASKEISSSQEKPPRHNLERGLLILVDPVNGKFHFEVSGPPQTMRPVPAGKRNAGPAARNRGGNTSSKKLKGRMKANPIDLPLSRRKGFSAPHVYPDDN